MSMLHIRLLDGFELVVDDGTPLNISATRQRELLVYLLLRRGQPQSRSHVAFLLWPDTSEKQALTNLRKHLSQLRARWPDLDRWLDTSNRTLLWRPDSPFILDVAEFECALHQASLSRETGSMSAERNALQKAIASYRGPLFPDVYTDWVLAARERLEQHYLHALERLIDLLEETRLYADAIAAAQRLLRHDPLRERTYRQLMRLHAVSGDRPLALRTYHSCVTLLSRELQVAPDRETELLYQRLVQKDSDGSPLRPTGQRVRRDRLIGRQPEWQHLLALWQQVLTGKSHLLVISGEAGIGKSRLARELYDWAHRQGMATARTRASAAAGDLAYMPVIEWLRSDALRPTLDHLNRVWLAEVSRLLPELRADYPDLSELVPLTDSSQRRRLFECLARACTVDAQPRLLLLDDLQWCDEETLAWLGFFLRFAPEARVLIMCTLRPQEVGTGHPLHELLSALHADGQHSDVRLEPLSLEESVTLAEQVLGHALEQALHERLFVETAGNPLFVVETAKAGLEEEAKETGTDQTATLMAPKIYAVIRSRLDRLSDDARLLVGLAAVIGRSFTFHELAGAGPLEEDRLMDALDELWQQGIIVGQGVDAYDFSHDRIRDVAYAGVSPVRRLQFHRLVAQALERIHAQHLDDVAARLASHWSAGGDRERAIDYYERAARVALGRLALSDVVTLLSACVALLKELPQTASVRKRMLTVMLDMMEPLKTTEGWSTSKTLPHCLLAQELSRAVGSPNQQFLATDALWSYHLMRGQQRKAYDCAQEMMALAQEFPAEPARSEFSSPHAHMGRSLLRLGELADAQKHFALANPASLHPGRINGIKDEVLVLWLTGYAGQARRLATALCDTPGDAPPKSRAIWRFTAMKLSYFLREHEALRRHTETLLVVADQYDMSFWAAAGTLFQGVYRVQSGEHQTGLAAMEAGIAGMERSGAGLFTLYLSMLVAAYAQTGRLDDGVGTLKRAMEYAEGGGEFFWYAELERQMADLLHAQGSRTDEIETWYQRALETAQGQGARSLALRAAVGLCRLWLDRGQSQAARDLLSPLYASFSEGFDTLDLIEARNLLDQLS